MMKPSEVTEINFLAPGPHKTYEPLLRAAELGSLAPVPCFGHHLVVICPQRFGVAHTYPLGARLRCQLLIWASTNLLGALKGIAGCPPLPRSHVGTTQNQTTGHWCHLVRLTVGAKPIVRSYVRMPRLCFLAL